MPCSKRRSRTLTEGSRTPRARQTKGTHVLHPHHYPERYTRHNHRTMAKIMNKTHDRLGLRPRCHSVVSIRDDTGTEIARRQSHNRETATQGRGRNLPRESTHPPQLGVSSAYNPGAFNTSLPITINGHATSALVDSGATDNFVRPRILSAGTPIRRQPDNYVLLAGEGKKWRS
jgi:hypothetical protein